VAEFLTNAEVRVPKSFKHTHGLKLTLEREFPGVLVNISAADIPKATADQVCLAPSHPVRSRQAGRPLPGTSSPEIGTDFLLAELQKVIDDYCQRYLPRLEREGR
jgi:hypothetical protein